jgi:hypothetical protein
MRLGLSALVIAALATSGLAACSSDSGGSGGSGGGSGGSTSETTGDTGGSTSETGTGGQGTGGDGSGGGVQECTVELVEPGGACDPGCDGTLSSDTATLCTFDCSEVACPEAPDGTFECVTDTASGVSVCDYTCAGGDACPGGFVCDEASSVCIPDTPDT